MARWFDAAFGLASFRVDIDGMRNIADRHCRFESLEPRRLLAGDTAAAAISGHVGVVEAVGGETASVGLGGVVVRLLDERGILVSDTTTDSNGSYQFDAVASGTYAVHELQPDGYVDRSARVGSGGGIALDPNLIGEIAVAAGIELRGYDFSEIATAEHPSSEPNVAPPLVAHAASSGDSLLPQDSSSVLLELPDRPRPSVGNPIAMAAVVPRSASQRPADGSFFSPVALPSTSAYGGSSRRIEAPASDTEEIGAAARDRAFETQGAAVDAITVEWGEEAHAEAEVSEAKVQRAQIDEEQAA